MFIVFIASKTQEWFKVKHERTIASIKGKLDDIVNDIAYQERQLSGMILKLTEKQQEINETKDRQKEYQETLDLLEAKSE